jgi:hypothetical protein
MKWILASVLAFGLATAACSHKQTKADQVEDDADERETVEAIRKRAAFDLSCEPAQVKVIKIADGSMWSPATYGATCGDKRVSYLQRMGTIVRQ